MTPIPAKVLSVDKQSSQYRVLVQIELEKYLGSFHTRGKNQQSGTNPGSFKRLEQTEVFEIRRKDTVYGYLFPRSS
jgi:hypothetical protein